MNKNTRINLLGVGCFWILLLTACSQPTPAPTLPVTIPPTETSPVTPTVVPSSTGTPEPTAIPHAAKPSDVIPERISWMKDQDSSKTAGEHHPGGGDDFINNLYERPFSANTQERYFPDIDIQETSLSYDNDWFYVAINLYSPDPQTNTLDGRYGVEVDFDLDGRGDILITAEKPGAEWSTDNVQVFVDTNKNVGDNTPVKSDPPQTGDGYETIIFDKGMGPDTDAAWVRMSSANTNVVWIAFKKNLVINNQQFMWGGWAERSVKNPAWMDYNDHFTFVEAGSPLPASTNYYPLKALAELDNTCRWTVGFKGVGNEPGICYIQPTPTNTPLPLTTTPQGTGTLQITPTAGTPAPVEPTAGVTPSEIPPSATPGG
jgi:hypothetical protein